MKRMSMKEFRRLVAEVMETLPAELQPFLDNVVVDAQEEPDIETLRDAGFSDEEIEAGETLLGLFAPMDGFSHDIDDPHRLYIFKRPHEEEFDDPCRLRVEIRKTVIHELAHHFGWTDRDLERFDDNPNPFGNG